MNKRQTVWLITRLIGVYFAYWAIVSLLSLVSAIYAYSSLPSAPKTPNKQTIEVNGVKIPTTAQRANEVSPTTTGAESPADKAKSDAMKEVFWKIFFTLIYGGIGFYLIRNGKLLFSTLIREELMDETEEISFSDSANSKEKNVTSLDLSPSSSSKKEEVTSLNLSEYVPKKQKVEPPIVENKSLKEEQSATLDVPREPIISEEIPPQIEQNENVNQPFFADEQPTLIRQIKTPLEEIPSAPIESPFAENEVKKRMRKTEEIVPTETTSSIDEQPNEQPNEQSAPSDILADTPLEEK